MDGYSTIKAIDFFSDDLKEFFETQGWYELSETEQTDKKFQEILNKWNSKEV